MDPRQPTERGTTFVEVAFGMLILVLAATALVQHLVVNYQTTATERDRVFAFAKAQAILAEIQAFVDRGQVAAAVDLDVLDDGVVNKPALTIATDGSGSLLAPDHALSGNYRRGADWVWSRRIVVQPFAGLDNRNVRYVTVRVFKRDAVGEEHPLADLSAVINSAGSAFPTTQVFDVYLLAIENIPGWWVFMDSIQPFVESMITDLETRNPGLQFRPHWITKASFGRNQGYRPYVNDAADSHAPIGQVYHYPGRMPAGSASTYYYVPDNLRGRVDQDGVERHGYDPDRNRHPYALADWFNHAMRLPEEQALWEARVAAVAAREAAIAAARAAGSPPPPELDDMSKEPTLRLFLEDLNTNPDKYRNALVINLHGELLPMPALRNYSDPARDPVNHPWARVVTHPEELRTRRDPVTPASSDALVLRMYAFHTHTPSYTGPAILGSPMVVEVMGVDLTDPSVPGALHAGCALQNVRGGVPVGGTSNYSTSWLPAKRAGDPTLVPNEMYYRAEFVDPGVAGAERFTRIYLHNTPLVCPQDGAGRGLANTERAQLYQMPYWPCPIEAAASFATDLTTTGPGPKNTARWKLRIAPTVLTDNSFVDTDGNRYRPTTDVRMTVRTRIWSGSDPAGSGTMWPPSARNAPENLSVTYSWWADSRDDVPATERAQFQGDPRHLPYRDCFNVAGADFPNAYNWFHDSLANGGEAGAADVPSIQASRLRNRWNAQVAADVPRFFELLRNGLVRSACVYTTLTGYSYYYLGLGNDVGYDAANGYPNSIPCNLTPHGSPGGTGFVDTITGSRRFVRRSGSGYWWGMPWLGELCPDDAHAEWAANDAGGAMRGNLTAGTGAGQFFQSAVNTCYSASGRTAFGTAILASHQRTQNPGCTAFFNIGSAGSSFQHVPSTGNGTLTAVGLELADNYNLTMPSAASITRPFRLAAAGATGEHWGFAPYTSRNTATLHRTYYTHAAGVGSGLVKLVDNANTSAAYVVVNGIANAVDTGTTFIAKYAMLTLVHSFFEAGSTTNTFRIPQPARVEIESPTDITELIDPATIAVQIGVGWQRWDGQPYAASGTYGEDESQLDYVLMYSNDGGAIWRHVADDSRATPGTRPAAAYLVADRGPGAESIDWDVPAAEFPEGSYLLRVDCFRRGAAVHYSYHQAKIFIQR